MSKAREDKLSALTLKREASLKF